MQARKKLIEVSLPLEAINAASAREKSIRHGHPSTLHLWWSRKPLATCRAVLFAQVVDDPSSWPERFENDEAKVDAERRRLHKIIEEIVPWEASNNEFILNRARWEIARSVAWGLGEEPPPKNDPKAILYYLQTKAPPVYDPFSGGGSIPLEAQRLGLRAYGSDLNPVAVLIGKALVEIPPKFADMPPVNPKVRGEAKDGAPRGWKGARGLADDVRYYGRWMRDEAEKRIGHFYSKAKLPNGSEATVIAWIWARTVRSPDPAARGAMVPLVTSFMLSAKGGKKAWIELVVDPNAVDGWRFEVRSGPLSEADETRLEQGTRAARATFRCVLSGASLSGGYIDDEAQAGRMSERLMAIVAEASRSRSYLSPTLEHEAKVNEAKLYVATHGDSMDLPRQECRGTFASNAQGRRYCFKTFADYFTSRQLLALTTFSDLVGEVREIVLSDARARLPDTGARLSSDGRDATAYADAVATYLGLGVSRLTDIQNALCRWEATKTQVRNLFGRQAIPMNWSFAENNLFNSAAGDFQTSLENLSNALVNTPALSGGAINEIDASKNSFGVTPAIVSTDPPYYDNVCYADLSDFFYVWLRRSLLHVWPDQFRRLTSPKGGELVATPYRHGGKAEAESFFMQGMSEALVSMRNAATDDMPLAIYYAYKQSEIQDEGVFSPGWTSFLQATIDAGLGVDGTWPIRTELSNRMTATDANSLASSIVLVCRKRATGSETVTRSELVRALKREMPREIEKIREAGVGPVDMQQSVIGPGMGIFSRYSKVLEDDDSAMTVRTALTLINRVWEEIDNELDAAFDPATQVALAWYATYGFEARSSGELITLANAKNIPSNALFSSGVFKDLRGKTGLTPREELPTNWQPTSDGTLTVWECVQHTARTLNAPDGGGEAAARLVAQMGSKSADARALAYRLFEIATKRSLASEALIYNELAQEWPKLEDIASSTATEPMNAQGRLALG